MRKLFFNAVIYTCLAFLVPVVTAHGQAVMPLSLEEARQHALEHNKNLVNAGLAIDEADKMLRETIAQGLPQISATADYNNFFGSTASLGGMPGAEFIIEFNPTSNLIFNVGQLIFSGSYIVGIQSARLFKEVTETSLEKTELDILAQVTQAYHLALVSKESRNIVASNLDNMRDLLEKTRAMVDVGVAEELDYDQLTVQAGMLEDALRAADRQVELSLNMLRLQMGMTADAEITLTDELDQILGFSDPQASLAKPFHLAENPDFRLMQLQTNLAERQIQMERAAYLPTLSGFYNYTEKLLKSEFDITPNHVIGLNLSIPIFSSGARKARVDQARINLKIAENQKELLSEQLEIQEKQLRFNLNNAIEQYESQLSNLEVARRVFESFNRKFEQGMVSSLDLVTANNNYLQAENGYVSAVMQLMEAHLELEKLLNTL